ncbi:GHKL domain-containing protein [Desulfofundulus thermobenzoicus]|uniref:histidine kinase n=1 Tax=Desulfofundulus thermobenzoicus TaxID=29376 RepID=A0A6N7IS93_9FIRM|nr:sensor histidine kinase [Desulfofundulus thermobenzoicus]MQL52379.1 GHKL domain-containing protein [Desulfofundulus thermobenzoicus]
MAVLGTYRRILPLRARLAILSFVSVVLAILVAVVLMGMKISHLLEEEMGMRALAIARTLAQMESIQNNVGRPGGAAVIQPIAEKTRLATGVAYIVVVDMNRVRYSHPVAERIGGRFTDPDLDQALSDREYTTRTAGVMGPAVRAFSPIKVDEGTRQVGVVVVGIITPTFGELFRAIQAQLYPSLAVGLLAALLGSLYLASRIKGAMFSLEPEEIARILEERTAMLQAMGDGIIAIDRDERITVLNEEAKRLLGVKDDMVGRPIREVLADSFLPRVLRTGQPEFNQERVLNNTIIIVNRVPVRVKGKIVGALASFRDRTEVHRLAEELTGVKSFVEALRVQNHEYLNRLHTIAGLIQLDRSQEAVDYIFAVTEEQQELTRLLTKNVCDYSIAGLLLGKYSRARELKVELAIDRSSRLSRLPPRMDAAALGVVLGNLLENALDAAREMEPARRQVYFAMRDDPEGLVMMVRDRGPGIPEHLREQIFKQGFSTKGNGRGIGLYLVKKHVDTAGGEINLHSREGEGTTVTVRIPYSA